MSESMNGLSQPSRSRSIRAASGNEEAARLYQTALDAFDGSDLREEEMRCELLLSLGEAEIRAAMTGRWEEAEQWMTGVCSSGPRSPGKASLGQSGRRHLFVAQPLQPR
jgi:hypothetical protein